MPTSNSLKLDLSIWDPIGVARTFSTYDAFNALANPRTLVFLCLCILLMAVADPANHSANLSPQLVFLLWSAITCVFLATKIAVHLLFALFQKHVLPLRIPLPLLTFVSLFPVVSLSENLAWLLSKQTFVSHFWQQFTILFIIAFLLEVLFFLFVLPTLGIEIRPQVKADASAEPEKPEEPSPLPTQSEDAALIIGTDRISIADIVCIEAKEHHVSVHLQDGLISTRARMKDIVAQTDKDQGIQPHRSWWVPRHMAKETVKVSGRHVLRLTNGRDIPLSRNRVKEVADWLTETAQITASTHTPFQSEKNHLASAPRNDEARDAVSRKPEESLPS